LRARPVRDGVELTLLDFDPVREQALRQACASLSEPQVPTLEDLFIELTTDRAAAAVRPSYGGAA